MASIQEALASLRQEIGSYPTVSQGPPYILHGHYEVAPFVVVQTAVPENTHARMDSIEQRIRQLRVSDSSSAWDDLDSMSVASLLVKFRMLDIERYTSVGCPRIHLRLYCIVMRAHGLDESQMITMFPLSLSGATQCRFIALESSRYRTWGSLRTSDRDHMSPFLSSSSTGGGDSRDC
ncbi:hypothetical protein PVL29_009085 [Vitis rotundifolia]|uniref:Uncharacterized protein n=1 Tax=Vitis rotundifolia TaxID=103349 RepID=A0AA38ZYB2_VITRO|nr:hypothetical protein PVL29_009085 [Vitis rotundifolia]